MASVSIQVGKQMFKQIETFYKPYQIEPVQHSVFRSKIGSTTITAYKSGKILFQGAHAQSEADQWQNSTNKPNNTKSNKQTSSDKNSSLPINFDQWTIIGSDEVGNGSYFGALTVCSVYLSPDQFELVKLYGVKDSKLLSDSEIIKIAEDLKQTVSYHLTVCNPEKYNQAIVSGYNAVSIKVSLHNHTIRRLISKLTKAQSERLQAILIDQFTPAANYMKYLKKENHPIDNNLYFEKQAERKHLAVASASIIARAAFLESLKKLGEEYHQQLPSGAGKNVDVIAAKLIRKYGVQSLNKTAKLHFKNTDKAKILAK
ncbi:ribonuclease HIII [Aerococcaceae bacterium WGS1372]